MIKVLKAIERSSNIEITWELLDNISKTYGESFYLLDSTKFEKNYYRLLKAFQSIYPDTIIAYSYKTNYIPKLCKLINKYGGWAEVVSDMEYELAIKVGVPPQKIIFNGPYKTEPIIEKVLLNGSIVNLDSYYELELVKNIAEKNIQNILNIGIRCNFKINDSTISRFGFDVENDNFESIFHFLKGSRNVNIKGLHCHFPNRNIDSFLLRTEKMLELSKKYFVNPPAFIDIGGGLFGEMDQELKIQFDTNTPSYEDYAMVIASRFKNRYQDIEDVMKPKLIIEPGTAIVADVMKFATKVINIKEIRSKKIATVGGSKYNINPTLNDKNLPIKVYHNPNYNCPRKNYENLDIAGYTCIETDYLYRNYNGLLNVDDYMVFSNVGSYSIVLKPPFILPNFAIIDISNNTFELVKRRETIENIFNTFIF